MSWAGFWAWVSVVGVVGWLIAMATSSGPLMGAALAVWVVGMLGHLVTS